MGIKQRVVDEVKEIGVVSAYFLCWFLLFLYLKKLILAEYHIEVSVFWTAIVGALVVAKVVVVLENTGLGERLRSGPLILHVAYRSFVYTAVVFVVTAAERLFDLYRSHGSLQAALDAGWDSRDIHHFLAMNISVALAFVVYNTYSEIDRHMGRGELRRFLLGF